MALKMTPKKYCMLTEKLIESDILYPAYTTNQLTYWHLVTDFRCVVKNSTCFGCLLIVTLNLLLLDEVLVEHIYYNVLHGKNVVCIPNGESVTGN